MNTKPNLGSAVVRCYSPFQGCAGDWVKLGVAKRHGAVLGDAVSKMADENTKFQLDESDIPGAELPKPAEFCTVAILKRWLSCRGAKVSRNRKDLIKRLDYESCNVNYFDICNCDQLTLDCHRELHILTLSA